MTKIIIYRTDFNLGLNEINPMIPKIKTGRINLKSKDIIKYTMRTKNKRTFVVPDN